MPPEISVIIPTYYRNELLEEAIQTVLHQDYEPFELIVVDDSGEGHAKPVLERYPNVKQIIRDTNGGWGRAYTDGIVSSTGDYIHFLDDDDLFLPTKLSKTAALLDANPNIGVAYSGLVSDVRGFQHPNPSVSGNVIEHALRFDMYPCCTITMLMRRELLFDILPLPSFADDLHLKIELAKRTRFDYVDECLVFRRKLESRKWVGLDKFAEMKRVVQHHEPLYDDHPDIRRTLLAELYEKEGQVRLDQQIWSLVAIINFLKATYYTEEGKFRCTAQILAGLFGRYGLNAARRVRMRALEAVKA